MNNTYQPIVLLAEDDPGDQELVKVAFAKNECPADLRIVNDGREAIEYLRREGKYEHASAPTPDLLLLDLNMPRMSGADVLRAIKADPELKSIPVVVFTTSEADTDIVNSYGLGCNSYISKPADVHEFIEKIGRLSGYWFDLVALPER